MCRQPLLPSVDGGTMTKKGPAKKTIVLAKTAALGAAVIFAVSFKSDIF
jgi:hypothetical protein